MGYRIWVFPRVWCLVFGVWCLVGRQTRHCTYFLRWVVGRLATAFLIFGWFRYSERPGGLPYLGVPACFWYSVDSGIRKDLVGYRIWVFPRVRCLVRIHTRYCTYFLSWVIGRLATVFLIFGWFWYSERLGGLPYLGVPACLVLSWETDQVLELVLMVGCQ